MRKRIQSPTSINTYLRCPRKYYLKYIKGWKTKPNIHLVRGAVVHQTIAKVSRMMSQPAPLVQPQDLLIQTFKDAWRKQAGVIQKLKLPSEKVDQFYRESQSMLLSWLARQAQSQMKTDRCEVRLYSRNFGVTGVIDAVCRLNQRSVLMDYKTCASLEISRDIRVQLAIYALLYRENHKVLPDMVGIDFLRQNKPRLFAVNARLIRYAEKMCRYIHGKTQSQDEHSYPCRCGRKCYEDFDL
jgi:CRISPR/Cas system-associated exonuclease Cas4 (RecB family)